MLPLLSTRKSLLVIDASGAEERTTAWYGSGNIPSPTLIRTFYSGPVLKLEITAGGTLTIKVPRLLFFGYGAPRLGASPSDTKLVTPTTYGVRAGTAITTKAGEDWYFWTSGWSAIYSLLAAHGFPTQDRIRELYEP